MVVLELWPFPILRIKVEGDEAGLQEGRQHVDLGLGDASVAERLRTGAVGDGIQNCDVVAGQGPACRDEQPDLAEQLPHTDGLLLRRTDPVLDILKHGGQSSSRLNGRLLQ